MMQRPPTRTSSRGSIPTIPWAEDDETGRSGRGSGGPRESSVKSAARRIDPDLLVDHSPILPLAPPGRSSRGKAVSGHAGRSRAEPDDDNGDDDDGFSRQRMPMLVSQHGHRSHDDDFDDIDDYGRGHVQSITVRLAAAAADAKGGVVLRNASSWLAKKKTFPAPHNHLHRQIKMWAERDAAFSAFITEGQPLEGGAEASASAVQGRQV